MPGHILPMGAGVAVMERRNDPLHDYVLELTVTAGGDTATKYVAIRVIR